MNGEFVCYKKIGCIEHKSCKVRKSIELACMLSGLSIEAVYGGLARCREYQNDGKITEIKSGVRFCDGVMCKKKKLIYKLIKKHNKLMKLNIVECKDSGKCWVGFLDKEIEERWNELIV